MRNTLKKKVMPGRAKRQGLVKNLLLAMGALVVLLIVVLIVIVTGDNGQKTVSEVPKNARFVQGVSVGGINVSGMTLDQAMKSSEIAAKAQEAYAGFTYTFAVQGGEFTYTAEQLGIVQSPEGVLKKAIEWGNVGDGDTRSRQRQQAAENGKNFSLPFADSEALKAALQVHKAEYDLLPQDATLKLADTFSPGNNADFVDEVKGVDVNIAELARVASENINSGDYSVIEAPSIVTDPKITGEELRANTVMITSWSSYFKGKDLGDKDRVTNIKLLAGFVNGSVIKPGEIWSINETGGKRTAETAKEVGWKEAPGIERGRYSEQFGGGVCQVSSTVYNASIRAELDIAERKAHSWPSSYILEGMDATISSEGPDLKIFNQYDYPVMFAAYVNEEEKSVTVEVYGPALKHGYEVDFEHIKLKETEPAPPIWHYNATQTPDGKAIAEGKKIDWVVSRKGQVWKIFKVYTDSEGGEVSRTEFTTTTYAAFQGEYYCNYPDPKLATPPPETSPAQ